MSVVHITGKEEFKKEVLDFAGISVVDFRAEWCGPCRMLGPVMEELAKDNSHSQIKITKINVDENQELAGAFEVSAIPVVFFMQNGKAVATITGANPKSVYQNKIDELLSQGK